MAGKRHLPVPASGHIQSALTARFKRTGRWRQVACVIDRLPVQEVELALKITLRDLAA